MAYDLAIVGSGAAGFAAAISARTSGSSVVMIERATIGGTCVNTGCVPSKALLAAAEAGHVALDQRFPGIATRASPVDVAGLIAGKASLVAAMRAAKYVDLAAEYGWEVVRGHARFAPGPVVEVTADDGDPVRVEAEQYLVATGSAPWVPPIDGLTQTGYLTSTTAMALDELPESLIVIGGNATGLELGQLFARLGVTVTVVEALPRLAPSEEPEISAAVAGILADEGITVRTGTQATAVRRDDLDRTVTTTGRDGSREFHADQLLIASGRRPVTAALNLDEVGVQIGVHNEIVVDEHLQTYNPRIWAAGDVIGHSQYVYVAAAHGTLAANNALNSAGRRTDYAALPRVTFTSPTVASVGLTEAAAIQHGYVCESRVLPMEHVPRAVVSRDVRGRIKLVAEAGTGRLLGVHIIADGAGEVVAAAVYALAAGMTVQQIADTWSPYLTMAEALKLAAQTYTRDVSKLSCCAT